MIQFNHIRFYKCLSLFILTAVLTSCGQYGVISENDVYMQKPTALNSGEDESDLTSYNAYKAGERGAYEDRYLIGQMYDRRFYGTLLYGGPFIGGIPYYSGNFISWGYMNPIRDYHNTLYYNNFYNWNRPWMFDYGSGYNPYANSFLGYGHPYYSPIGNPYYTPYWNGSYGNNQSSTTANHFSGQKRFSLSANAPRSSSYPSTLKSNNPESSIGSSGNLSTDGTSRRAAGKKSVQSSHMPFKENTQYGGQYQSSTNSGANYRGTTVGSSRQNVSTSRTNRSGYTPSQSARRSGIARTPRSTNNYERSTYNSSSTRRTTSGSPSRSRGTNYNSRSRSISTGTSRSGSSTRPSSSSSSSSSSSGRR